MSINWIVEQIAKTVNSQFYGSITLNFQKGNLTHVETRKIDKPEAVDRESQKT